MAASAIPTYYMYDFVNSKGKVTVATGTQLDVQIYTGVCVSFFRVKSRISLRSSGYVQQLAYNFFSLTAMAECMDTQSASAQM